METSNPRMSFSPKTLMAASQISALLLSWASLLSPLEVQATEHPRLWKLKESPKNLAFTAMGFLLLEMLTGKSPVQSAGQDEVLDLPRWIQSVVREEWTAEVFDVELMKYQSIEEEIVQMLQIAMACVAKEQEMRPRMDELVGMMEELGTSYSDKSIVIRR